MTHAHDKEVSRRTDGEKTKAKILAEAMRLTAEKGYNGVTSKEICEASGVNTALVSYYFGSRKLLHQEVLKQAHNQLFSMEEILRISSLPISAEEKLKELLSHIFKREKNSTMLQAVKIFLWEIRSPSDALKPNLEETVLPKLSIFLQLGSQISGLPADSPELRRTMFLVVAPCIISVLFPSMMLNTLFNFTSVSNEQFIILIWSHALTILRDVGLQSQKKGQTLQEEGRTTYPKEGEDTTVLAGSSFESTLKIKLPAS